MQFVVVVVVFRRVEHRITRPFTDKAATIDRDNDLQSIRRKDRNSDFL